jgi:hypothetical protein
MVDLLDQLQHHSLDTPLYLAGFLRQVNLHGGVCDIDQTRVDAISIAVPEPYQEHSSALILGNQCNRCFNLGKAPFGQSGNS